MEQKNMHIVVEDPGGVYFEGSLIDGVRARQLGAKGVTSMPVNPELFQKSGVGGFFMRHWGAGWPLDSLHPRMNCPMLLHCDAEHKVLHWRARLAPTAEFSALDSKHRAGQIQLAVDTGQRTPFSSTLVGAIKPVAVKELETPDQLGGWVVGGTAALGCRSEGHSGFALYGYAPGLHVLWVAMTATSEDSR
jgi:hypothetical protein